MTNVKVRKLGEREFEVENVGTGETALVISANVIPRRSSIRTALEIVGPIRVDYV